MSVYHAPRIADAGVPETRANAFAVLTNGVVARDAVDRIDTWNSDNLGQTLDFVGLSYDSPSRFDTIVIEQGTQFPDGGDWESTPKIYILKDLTLVGDTVEPNMASNWVEVTGATTAHVFPADTTGVIPEQIVFDLSAISATDRTGWGWAVGGVDGNDTFHFISLTEAWATGESGQAAPLPPPASLTPDPVNLIANSIGSVGRTTDGLTTWRGQAFASVVNGVVDNTVGSDGFDTWQGDADGTLTDFVGLQYRSQYTFDSITVDLGVQFVDGGDWEEMPRIFMLKNPVDTGGTRPEEDPANWVEITGFTETTGHVFAPIVVPGEGGIMTFDLSSIHPALRTGYGWAVGGVDGNQRESDGNWNFLSITELSATGQLVPEPSSMVLLALGLGLVGYVARRGLRK